MAAAALENGSRSWSPTTSVPGLRAIFGRRRGRHRRVPGLDRRIWPAASVTARPSLSSSRTALGIIPYNITIYGARGLVQCRPVTNPDGSVHARTGREPRRALRPSSPVTRRASLRARAPQRERLPRTAPTPPGWAWARPPTASTGAGTDPTTGAPLAEASFSTRSQLPDHRAWDPVRNLGLDVHGFATNPEEGRLAARKLRLVREPVQPGHRLRSRLQPAYAATVTAQIQGLMGSARRHAAVRDRPSRNGRGPLDTAVYGAAPYNQPGGVIRRAQRRQLVQSPRGGRPGCARRRRRMCRWSTRTCGVKIPGESDGSCDIAGGARGWDYAQYNRWGVTGDAQNHFESALGHGRPPPPAPGSRSRPSNWRKRPSRAAPLRLCSRLRRPA
jgi:hypothetical protein